MAVKVFPHFKVSVLIVGMLTISGFFGNAQVTDDKTSEPDSVTGYILIINSFDAMSYD
jgi:hypothetical protein